MRFCSITVCLSLDEPNACIFPEVKIYQFVEQIWVILICSQRIPFIPIQGILLWLSEHERSGHYGGCRRTSYLSNTGLQIDVSSGFIWKKDEVLSFG